MELTHFNEQGRARMVDVSEKVQTYRVARAAATVRMAKATMDKIKEGSIGKGDVLAVAQVCIRDSTVYDMCKAVQRDMRIDSIHLLYKEGGKSGVYEAEE
mgnify:CR=1 FL=1